MIAGRAAFAPAPAAKADADALVARFRDRSALIGIVGLGYVGLPLVSAMSEKGLAVTGFDVDGAKVASLNQGRSYIRHIPDRTVAALVERHKFRAATDFAELAEVDAVLICVPTPLTRHREPDLSYIVQTTEAVAPHVRRGQLIVLESTTYPGTTRDVMKPILERGGLKSGVDFFLAYSPEREDPGNTQFSTARIPKVVGGDGPDALRLARALYDQFVDGTVPVSNAETAEAVKLTENIFRAVNIALVNELKVIYDAMGIDVWEVIDAAKTKPFGFMPFYPGPGLGGHCIPIDPFYLTWKAHEYGIATRFIELAGEINTRMPYHIVSRVAETLDRKAGVSLSRASVLILGITYKKNIDDMRESPSLTLIQLLEARGARVEFYDPYIPVIPETREHGHLTRRRSVDWSRETLAKFDVALIATDHDAFDYNDLVTHAKLIVDTRNACGARGLTGEKIVKA
ncbi:MAG: nucleotide sugar dehydrogenase [Roseiarcus sp.]